MRKDIRGLMVGTIATVVAGAGLVVLVAISPKNPATVQQSTKPAISSSPSTSPSPEATQPAQTAKETCGDSGSADSWYPVFIDGGNLGELQAKFCKDAIAKIREKTGKPTVQLASFSDRDRAEAFARSVNGEVGEPLQKKSVKKEAKKTEPLKISLTEQERAENQYIVGMTVSLMTFKQELSKVQELPPNEQMQKSLDSYCTFRQQGYSREDYASQILTHNGTRSTEFAGDRAFIHYLAVLEKSATIDNGLCPQYQPK